MNDYNVRFIDEIDAYEILNQSGECFGTYVYEAEAQNRCNELNEYHIERDLFKQTQWLKGAK